MRHITQKQALKAAKELATDIVYTRSMTTGWKPPAEARELLVLPIAPASNQLVPCTVTACKSNSIDGLWFLKFKHKFLCALFFAFRSLELQKMPGDS